MANGAAREGSSLKRLPFEQGNWKGQMLNSDERHYDQIYLRNYVPEALRD